ncbi:hypothetical protein GCM10010988_03140 [Cnuibacter physcomitrellae]|uniref:Uncharacterized protein n=1 Tax=Cnuibacter physcomitrellae TaxID=1619308 RepID=A0A1X9LLS6_9MICO|nr:hypothetical protein [Cnuibacter physcomitrellae]ARJ05248.1 hypothetical protein B5808_08505 [Cnuibacter physcomitrellae]GGI35281.1 hypothetical protein GCM10010988_03140 [Cnuibacter physcomitrellae]
MRLPEDLSAAARRTLDQIRFHPTTHGVSWNELLAMLGEIADVEESGGGAKATIRMGDDRVDLERPRSGVVAEAPILELRRMFKDQGLL